jgi:hypothetical protein
LLYILLNYCYFVHLLLNTIRKLYILLWHHFLQYFSYIVAVSFIGGGNQSTQRKPPTCHKSLTNFITLCRIKYLNLQLLVQSWAITSNVVISKKCAHGKVYLILHSVIKFVSDLWQVGGFLWVLWFPPPIRLFAT